IQNLGLVALDRGDYQEAATMLGQSLVMHRTQGRQNTEAEVLCDLGRVRYCLDDYQDALDLYQTSLNICKKIPYPEYEWRSLFGIARCLLKMEEQPRAIETLRAAVAVIDQLRAQLPSNTELDLFMRDKLAVYDLLESLA